MMFGSRTPPIPHLAADRSSRPSQSEILPLVCTMRKSANQTLHPRALVVLSYNFKVQAARKHSISFLPSIRVSTACRISPQ
jgi:hypothetical protein